MAAQFTLIHKHFTFDTMILLLFPICKGNTLHVGDHIPWHKPLDGKEDSIVQHMLVAKDPQLLEINSPYGHLDFRQVLHISFLG